MRAKKDQLNQNETKVLAVLRANGPGATIDDMRCIAFKSRTRTQGQSWVRNALRKLVRLKLAKQIGRGTYSALSGSLARRAAVEKGTTVPTSAPPAVRDSDKTPLYVRIEAAVTDRGPMTDHQIADMLHVPEPSVRRARQKTKLVERGSSLGYKLWGFPVGVLPAPAA